MTNACARSPRAARRRLARSATALASFLLLGVPPSSALAAGWVEGPRLAVAANAPGVAVGVAPDGAVEAAWYEVDATGMPTSLQAQHVAPDGAVAAPVSLGAGANPVIATSTNGSSAVAWLQVDPAPRDAVLHLTLLDAGGVRTSDVTVAAFPVSGVVPSYDVALDAAGNATIVWAQPQTRTSAPLQAMRVRADGTHSDAVTVGDAAVVQPGYVVDPSPRVAGAPDGSAWIGWVSSAGSRAQAARLNPAGELDVPAVTLSAPDDEVGGLALASSATGGTAIAWGANDPEANEPDPSATPTSHIAGVRLGSGGAIAGSAFGVTGAMSIAPGSGLYGIPPFTIGVGPDGAISLAWLRAAGLFPRAALSRFAVGQGTVAAHLLDPGVAGSDGEANAQVSVAPDGSAIATWQSFSLATGAQTPKAAQIAPDGSIGATGPLPITLQNAFSAATPMPRAANGASAYAAAVIGNLGPGAGRVTFTAGLYRVGTPGPTITAAVPATGVALTPIALSGTVSGAADDTLTWEFGDGASARGLNLTHAYVTPGTYTVTARASDRHGITTTVTRQIAIAPAPTGGGPAPPRATATAARLKITRATREGAKVTVRGTIDRRAGGKVTIAYAQRVKRRTIKVRQSARIAKGAWRATLRLPRTLNRGKAASAKGTVTVTFSGTTAVRRAHATRTVSLAT
ncbi:PKD domain-containing protein [Conexibacter stalactiti]|uniref:PKD domain-containing protein n=1 Tax=Conexibacter stalactiti TaxID=1940611 RepID=A0ABU4HPA8_9ACTN|nr:PKD domain-containing protein [Conexibacter stalactiti]MDW5595126.1 PKD domain-containing protein [Conexibacter stalactiti]MEC5035768.1 PKD domain-containing protein [Conexibacter stalactiti]